MVIAKIVTYLCYILNPFFYLKVKQASPMGSATLHKKAAELYA